MGKLDSHYDHRNSRPRQAAASRAHTPAPAAPPDIITYRLEGKMVYVTPAETYEEGVTFAKAVFEELSGVHPERITFSVSVNMPGGGRTVQISPMAWRAVVSTLAQYEIVDLVVLPEVVVDFADAELPQYADIDNKESREHLSRSPSPQEKSRPSSRSASRVASRSPSRNPGSPSRTERALNWFEKVIN